MRKIIEAFVNEVAPYDYKLPDKYKEEGDKEYLVIEEEPGGEIWQVFGKDMRDAVSKFSNLVRKKKLVPNKKVGDFGEKTWSCVLYSDYRNHNFKKYRYYIEK